MSAHRSFHDAVRRALADMPQMDLSEFPELEVSLGEAAAALKDLVAQLDEVDRDETPDEAT